MAPSPLEDVPGRKGCFAEVGWGTIALHPFANSQNSLVSSEGVRAENKFQAKIHSSPGRKVANELGP